MQAHFPPPPKFPPSYEVRILPAQPGGSTNALVNSPEYWSACGFTLKSIISTIWGLKPNRIFVPNALDKSDLFDFVLLPPKPLEDEEQIKLLRQGVEKHFGIQVLHEKRNMPVLVLSAPNGKSANLKELDVGGMNVLGSGVGGSDSELSGEGAVMADFCEIVERFEHSIVVDETNLKGHYSFHVRGSGGGFAKMLREQLGLVLTKAEREVDVLVVKQRE